MAQLIQMRQRIKAIETIKKITHAMRLIAMSSHLNMKTKYEPLKHYREEVATLFNRLKKINPEISNNFINPKTQEKNILIILIGSQKGLCGSFNTMLFHHFEHYLKQNSIEQYSIIGIGKRAVDYIHKSHNIPLIAAYEEINMNSIASICSQIIKIIATQTKPFSMVLVASNYLKSFFTQKPQVISLIPFDIVSKEDINTDSFDEYIWEQDSSMILNVVTQLSIDAHLQYLLFESLLAEHAARFISMDSSTRNAQNLLETTKLDYNKLRQAKITKELSELMGNF